MTLDEIYQSLDPVAFSWGPFTVYWYGLGYLAGFVLAGIVIYRTARSWDIDLTLDDVLAHMIGVALGIILGGRLGYILFYGKGYYLAHPLAIFALNEGGMSFHGGLIGAIVGALITAREEHLNFLTMADLTVLGAPLGIFLVRCANFVNGELWGKPTDLPWGVVFETGGAIARHPSQLYEALLEGIFLFIVLKIAAKKRPVYPQGSFLSLFLLLYGICRFALEFVRVPDAHMGYLVGWLTMGQLLSIPLILAGALGLILTRSYNKVQQAHLD